MIKIEKTETYGWEAAIRGMRNPMNSWDKSDTRICDEYMINEYCPYWGTISDIIGSDKCPYSGDCQNGVACNDYQKMQLDPNDLDLMKRLAKAGTDHRKFMRMITVYCDITAPLYWWKEFDTYKVGTVANSCSTMHKIQVKEFVIDDFSHEHVIDFFHDTDTSVYMNDDGTYNFDTSPVIIVESMHDETFYEPTGVLELQIKILNKCRELYLKTKDKKYWWQMIQLLPSSYNQKRTIMMNYEVLANIYKSRKNHKLDEWCTFCHWIETLPYFELIVGEE